MGDDDERAAPGAQVRGQPVDALDVEVVGRLVEDDAGRARGRAAGPARPGAARRRTARRPARPAHRAAPERRARRAARPARRARAPARPTRARGGRRAPRGAPSHRRVEVVALGQVAQPRGRPTRVTRPSSGVPAAGQHVEQGGLAAAVAPDDADPVAVGDPERDPVEHRAGPEHHPGALDVDQVASHAHGSTRSVRRGRRAPGPAPGAPRGRPATRSTRPRPRGRPRRRATRKATVGPEPETTAPSAPCSSPTCQRLAQLRGAASRRPPAGR